jgi:hypothetical protein
VAFVIGFGCAFALVLLWAVVLDLQDRRRGRKSRMRMAGWLQRSGQVYAANSPMTYMLDQKGLGSGYSAEPLRKARPGNDDRRG